MLRYFVHAAIFASLVFLPTTSDADIVVSVSDDGNDLLFEWIGNLELEALNSDGTFGGTANLMTPSVPRMHGITGGADFYDFPSPVLSPFGTGTDLLQNGLMTGDSFGLTVVNSGPRLFVPPGYTNQILTGSLLFTGETVASQGIDLSTPVVYDFGAVGTVTFQSVPEPSSLVLLGVGVVALIRRRRPATIDT